jgi:hypothetical protein
MECDYDVILSRNGLGIHNHGFAVYGQPVDFAPLVTNKKPMAWSFELVTAATKSVQWQIL